MMQSCYVGINFLGLEKTIGDSYLYLVLSVELCLALERSRICCMAVIIWEMFHRQENNTVFSLVCLLMPAVLCLRSRHMHTTNSEKQACYYREVVCVFPNHHLNLYLTSATQQFSSIKR